MERFMRTCTEVLQQPPLSKLDVSEFEAIGIKVSKQLQRMSPYQAILADSLISNVLKRGLLNTIRDETTLCDHSSHITTQFSSHASSSGSSSIQFPSPITSNETTDFMQSSQYTSNLSQNETNLRHTPESNSEIGLLNY